MRVLITGAAGFIGRRLTQALLARGRLADAQGAPAAIERLVLTDRVPPPAPANPDGIAIRTEVGDLADPQFQRRLLRGGIDSVFHLAAALTPEAAADSARAVEGNVTSLIQLLELCRGQRPKFVYTSSIAVYGGRLPEQVDDATAQRPQTSYGTHKAIAELLIEDYSRQGAIDGRTLRLPIVLIRRDGANSVSDRIAAIVREPVLGRDVACPFAPETRLAVASVRNAAESLLTLHDVPADGLRDGRSFNLPALTVTVASMLTALKRVAPDRVAHVSYAADPELQAIVDGWPKRFVSKPAERLGITADPDFDSIIREFMDSPAG